MLIAKGIGTKLIDAPFFSRSNRVITWRFYRRSPWVAASQGYFSSQAFCVPKMGGTKDGRDLSDRYKKRKMVIPVWRPISTQSAGRAMSLSSSSVDYDSKPKAIKEEKSTCAACKVESFSEMPEHTAISEACQQVEVMEESMHDYSSNKDVELVSQVEKHSIFVEVDPSLIRFIKGKGGSTQKQIEGENGVTITFPSSKKDNCIVIEGNTNGSVTKASQRIASVIEEAVKSPRLDYSHFISLPLAIHPELVDKLQKFQNDILGCTTSCQDGTSCSDLKEDTSDDSDDENNRISVNLEVESEKEYVSVKIAMEDAIAGTNVSKLESSVLSELGIEKSIFIKPKTFHLTVLMLKLWNKERVATATETLQKISLQVKDALDDRPVFIRLKGLECMRGSPAKARVLYVPVEEIGGEGRLLRACQVITEAFVEAGLVLEKDARQTLKLHATLMNARHRKRKKRTRLRDSFDARGIFLRYGSEQWGDYLIREAHLSQRFVFDESGYYHCCASIPFPESMQVK